MRFLRIKLELLHWTGGVPPTAAHRDPDGPPRDARTILARRRGQREEGGGREKSSEVFRRTGGDLEGPVRCGSCDPRRSGERTARLETPRLRGRVDRPPPSSARGRRRSGRPEGHGRFEAEGTSDARARRGPERRRGQVHAQGRRLQ